VKSIPDHRELDIARALGAPRVQRRPETPNSYRFRRRSLLWRQVAGRQTRQQMDRQALADAYSAITVHADAEQANQSTTRPHRVAPHNQAQTDESWLPLRATLEARPDGVHQPVDSRAGKLGTCRCRQRGTPIEAHPGGTELTSRTPDPAVRSAHEDARSILGGRRLYARGCRNPPPTALTWLPSSSGGAWGRGRME
jgi:hypothetical protein